jgi:hypothetical protein
MRFLPVVVFSAAEGCNSASLEACGGTNAYIQTCPDIVSWRAVNSFMLRLQSSEADMLQKPVREGQADKPCAWDRRKKQLVARRWVERIVHHFQPLMRETIIPCLTLKSCNDAEEKEVEWRKSCTTLRLPRNNIEKGGTGVLWRLCYSFVLLHPQYDLGKSEYFTSSFLKLAAMWG